MPAWEDRLQADITQESYRILWTRDTSRSSHWCSRFVKWQAIVLELDRTRQLPVMVAKGRYFLLFLYYYRALRYWGLEADGEIWPAQDEDHEQAMIAAWRRRPDDLPEPFVRANGHSLLSSDFLRRGWYLLLGPLAEDPQFERARTAVNASAHRAMNVLYQEVLTLERMPDPIRTVLRQHRATFEEFTLPI